MHQAQVLSRALQTHNFKKDVAETGAVRDRNPSDILGKAQDSLFTSKTGLRRLFGGESNKDLAVPITAPDEPETLEISEPSRQFSSVGDVTARVAKARRSSMTTYTVNLGGGLGGQVEREVRRLAGLTTAFTRSSPANDAVTVAYATSFDTIEEMGVPVAGTGAGDDSYADGTTQPRPSSYGVNIRSGAAGSGSNSRGPIKAAFGTASGTGSGDMCRVSVSDDLSGFRQSVELADVTSMPSSSNLASTSTLVAAASPRPQRSPPLPQAFLGPVGTAAAAAAAGSGVRGSNCGSSLSISPVTPTSGSQLVGQLGLMKDRKISRSNAVEGFSTSSSLTGTLMTPTTAGGASVAAGPGTPAPPPVTGGPVPAPVSVLKLPTLPPTPPCRALSGSQIGLPQSPFMTPTMAAAGAAPGTGGGGGIPPTDSRPDSSRLVLGRGSTSTAFAAPDRRISVENIELGAGVVTGGSGGALGRAGLEGVAGGRWFQQDVDDIEAMLSSSEEMLERFMLAGSPACGISGSFAGFGGGGVSGGKVAQGSSDGSFFGEPGLLLPRLADATPGPQDRATAQLQELWRVQANVEDQLNRDRQAMAAGRTRRASVLEDVAGQHQPRWQVSYNTDAPVTHAKLGVVDASRRSELDKAHLTKLMKEQKVPTPPAVPAAAVSPVVARARRLSTVMVA